MTRIHSITAFTVLAVVLMIIRRAHRAEKFALREQVRLMTLLVAQGAVGYWQYFTGVPVQLWRCITLLDPWIQIVPLVAGRTGTGARSCSRDGHHHGHRHRGRCGVRSPMEGDRLG